MFSFSGYGTVGVVHSTEDQADFTANGIFKPNGAGHSRAWSADVDSRLGVQIGAQFTPKLSAVLQVVSEQQYDNTYTPNVEWVNLKYAVTPEFSVRVGRVVLSSFLYSDVFKVGYAYPWVRPPVEIYRILPITSLDGFDASYRWSLGDWTHALQANVGWKKTPQPHDRGSVKADRVWTIADTVEHGALTLHAAYGEASLSAKSIHALFDGFRQFGAQGAAIADRYDVFDTVVRTASAGFSYDPGSWFVIGEGGKFHSRSVFGKSSAWYLSNGYRIGNFTPYLTYSRIRTNGNTADPGLDPTIFPPSAVAPLNAALNGILASAPGQRTLSIGTRWDFMKNVDLKVQFDHSRLDAGSPGLLINPQPDFHSGGSYNLFSATLDFVF